MSLNEIKKIERKNETKDKIEPHYTALPKIEPAN